MSSGVYNFIRSVLPVGQYKYCLSINGAGTRWSDTVWDTPDDIVAHALRSTRQTNDIYFALSGFREGYHNNANNKRVFRTQDNAVAQRSLWLDIDCGKDDSKYKNSDTGIRALSDFLSSTSLPVPHIVSSGHGLHIYWAFNENVPTAQWRIMASMLKALCVQHGFDADHSRTTDPSSVLRVPDTWNADLKNKYGQGPTQVKILHLSKPYPVLEIAKILVDKAPPVQPVQPKAVAPVAPAAKLPPPPPGVQFGNMAETFNGPKRHPLNIIKGCKQIQLAGVGTYTQWYNMMLVMKHCEFGERAVHDISKMDAKRYDYNNVQTKYEQAIAGGYGPCRCETFNSKDPGVCDKCPHWGKIGSPLLLGEVYVPPEDKPAIQPVKITAPNLDHDFKSSVLVPFKKGGETIDVLPFHNKEFSVVPGKGVVWHKPVKAQGDEEGFATVDVLLTPIELYIHSLVVDYTPEEGVTRKYIMRKHTRDCVPEDIAFSIDKDFSSQGTTKWFAQAGMLPSSAAHNKVLANFMQAYIASIQNKLPHIYVRDHFGWHKETDRVSGESYDSFLIGETLLSKHGEQKVHLDDRAKQFGTMLHPSGSLEVWKELPKMYRHLNQPFAALMMCAAFAAPFMKMGIGTATNVAYNLWDIKGGKGKSTLLEMAASVWGNPSAILLTKNDTNVSRFQQFAVYKNIPVYCDEITQMKDEVMADLVYDIVNGREKSRSNQAGTNVIKGGNWQTIAMFTSNKSMYEALRSYRVQSDATCMRVIEMVCDFKDYSGTPTQDYISKVTEFIRIHYGHAGREFMRFCLTHPEVFDMVKQYADDFVRTYTQSADERFWMYGLALPLAAGIVARAAGLLDYDVLGWLEPYVINRVLPTIRGIVKAPNPTGANLLSEFLNEHLDNTLVVASANRPANVKDMGMESGMDTWVKAYPNNKLAIRHELDTNTFYVSAKVLQRWCQDNNITMTVMLQELANLHMFTLGGKVQVSLGQGVAIVDRSRVMCYKFTIRGADSDAKVK